MLLQPKILNYTSSLVATSHLTHSKGEKAAGLVNLGWGKQMFSVRL